MRVSVNITPGGLILGALLLLVIPLQWFISALLAAAFHEFCHYVAVSICRGHVYVLHISHSGAKMESSPLSPGQELFCALAGPAGSFFLLIFFRSFPRLALCALIQGIFNLLPLYPLDGGRAFRCAIRIFREKFLAKRRISGYNSVTMNKEVTL